MFQNLIKKEVNGEGTEKIIGARVQRERKPVKRCSEMKGYRLWVKRIRGSR